MQNVLWGYAVDPQFVRLLRLALSTDDSDPDTLALAAMTSAFMVGDSESEIEWPTGRSRLIQIHFAHGAAEAKWKAGLPE
jgi:hypothetical protein